jgi:hypothetical protein
VQPGEAGCVAAARWWTGRAVDTRAIADLEGDVRGDFGVRQIQVVEGAARFDMRVLNADSSCRWWR